MKYIYIFAILVLFVGCKPRSSYFDDSLLKNPAWEEQWKMLKYEQYSEIDEIAIFKNIRTQYKRASKNVSGNLSNEVDLGPFNVAGRVRAFLIDSEDENRFIAGGVSGGLWQSFDRGESWAPIEIDEPNMSVTSISQSPINPDIIYFSAGEVTGNSAGINGMGIYKSINSGQTFELLPSSIVTDFVRTWRIRCSPIDENTIYIATRTGLFSSSDGGENFDQLIFTHTSDVEIWPNGSVIAGVDEDGLYMSEDGSENSFTRIEDDNLPDPAKIGRVELAISPSDENILYAIYEHRDSAFIFNVYGSIDRGITWKLKENPNNFDVPSNFAWYCLTLAVHPTRPEVLIAATNRGAFSLDGGETWTRSFPTHADKHLVVFDYNNEDRMFLCSDGGIDEYDFVGDDFSVSRSLNNGLNITQFYAGSVFPNSDRVLGGTQDNGSLMNNINSVSFAKIFGGDGGYNAINSRDTTVGFVSYQRGNFMRVNGLTAVFGMDFTDISSFFDSDDAYFIAPFELDELEPDRLFYFDNLHVWKSENQGDDWDVIANLSFPYGMTLVDNNRTKSLVISGGSGGLYLVNDIEFVDTIAPIKVLNKNIPNEISESFIIDVETDPHDNSVVYCAISSFNFEPHLWKVSEIFSDDEIWTPINGDLSNDIPVNTIDIDPNNADRMVIGTDFGVYTTINGGINWIFENNIPSAPVFKVILKENNRIYAFTHGRGIWAADFMDIISSVEDNPVATNYIESFPNPAQNQINILGQNINHLDGYKIYSLSRQLLMQSEDGREFQNGIIDISSFQPGIYFGYIYEKEKMVGRTKFVKL